MLCFFRRTLVTTASIVCLAPLGCQSISNQLASDAGNNGNSGSMSAYKPKIEEDIEVKPTARMMVDFGTYKLTVGQFMEAKQYFDKALSMTAHFPPAIVGLSNVALGLGQSDEARKIVADELVRQPKAPELWNQSAMVEARLGNMKAAIEAAQQAVTLAPASSLYRENLAGMLAVGGRSDEALAEYKKLVPAAEAHFKIAGVLNAQGDRAGAINHLRLANQADPRHKAAAEMLLAMTHAGPGMPMVDRELVPATLNVPVTDPGLPPFDLRQE